MGCEEEMIKCLGLLSDKVGLVAGILFGGAALFLGWLGFLAGIIYRRGLIGCVCLVVCACGGLLILVSQSWYVFGDPLAVWCPGNIIS